MQTSLLHWNHIKLSAIKNELVSILWAVSAAPVAVRRGNGPAVAAHELCVPRNNRRALLAVYQPPTTPPPRHGESDPRCINVSNSSSVGKCINRHYK